MTKRIDALHPEDATLMRRVRAAVERNADVIARKARAAQRTEARRIKSGQGASFLEGGQLEGGAHTDHAAGGAPTSLTPPTPFLPPPDPNTQVVWSPQPGPQYHFIHCPVTDVVFGGARGGGKTYALIGDAAIRAGRYGRDFRGLFLRRQQTELADVKMKMAEVYGPIGAKWSEQHQTWTFPGGGTLVLKYLMNDDDALLYKGWNVTALYVDEIGDFASRRPIDLLWGAMRSAKGVPIVRRMSCNPGGPGHMWVKQLYLSHGRYRVFRYTPNPELPDMTIDAVFIPSRLEDNKILMQNDPMYETRLSAACGGDMVLYHAWREGDWDGLAGAYFTFDEKVNVAVPPPIPPYLQRWMAIDWGYTHPTAVQWCVDFGDRAYVYRERYYTNTEPVSLGMFIAEVNGDEPISNVYLSPDAFAKRTSVNTVASELEEGFRRAHEMKGLALIPSPEMAFNDRVNGWQVLAAGLGQGRLMISPSCPEIIRTLPSMVRDPKKPNDVQKVDGDDACLVAGTMVTMADGTARAIETLVPGDVVATPCGPGNVSAAGQTKADAFLWGVRVKVAVDGSTVRLRLSGTANHHLYAPGGEKVRIDKLQEGQMLELKGGRTGTVTAAWRHGVRAPVYNLTVDCCHRFYANGILSANCDCLRYLWATRQGGKVNVPMELRAAQEITAENPTWRAMQERIFLSRENAVGGDGAGVTIRGRRRFFSGYE